MLFLTSSPFVGSGVFDGSYSSRSEWNLSVILICISVTAWDGEHFFMFFYPFGLLLLKKFFLVQFSISLSGY
jgi:hypothetical protein